MGKRAEKTGRAAAKQKQVAACSPKSVLQQWDPVENADDGLSVAKERKPCPHLDKGIDLDKISAKIGSSDSIRCEECREGISDRRGKKGKGKHGKKGSASTDFKSDSKATWVCLDCGHYACGGVGLPTTPQSHVVWHSRQTRHPLVIQWENLHLRWCFPCNMLIPVETAEENGENKDAFSEVVKLIKERSTEGSSADVEDVWSGSGSVTSEIKSESTVLSGSVLDGYAGYVVRGLVNLGNTCFFNSAMQNLLALSRLRDYFLNADASFGPLTIALKKLFAETKPETGLRNVLNPRLFFGCICSKAPQFRGYQQQDSHELLCCLLDGLCTEEMGARKRNNSEENRNSSYQVPTFVDSVFGGQISSTVRCVECGHSSTVYEPFLDLSLPVPTKKAPSKKAQPTFRAKKAKLPPKKNERVRPNCNRDTDTVTIQTISNPSASTESQRPTVSTAPHNEKLVRSSGGYELSYSVGSSTMTSQSASALQNFSADLQAEHNQVLDNPIDQTMDALDDFSWLDYIEPQTISDVHDSTLQNSDISFFQDSGEFAWFDYLKPESKSHEYDLSLQNNDVLLIPDAGDKDKVSDDSLINSNQVPGLDLKPNLKPESSSGNAGEDELLLMVQDSEVILLPYNEEISSSVEITGGEAEASSLVEGCGQEELDFDGFGELFNEPKIATEPVTRSSLGIETLESGFGVGNCSDSDPDQVDDSNSSVSVESCLVHFIKPELLTDDNTWDCESCSKTLQRQKLETLKKRAELDSKTLINGGEIGKQNDLQSTKDISCLSDVKNLNNGDIKTNIALNAFSKSLASKNGETDCLNQNCAGVESGQTCEMNPVVSILGKGKMKMNDTVEEQSQSSCIHKSRSEERIIDEAEDSCIVDESSSTGYTADTVHWSNSQFIAGNCESAESKGEELNSENIKVKRDATKRVLINKAPPILTIHLKRFSQDARGRLSKLNGHVNFSETINLGPFMDPRCTDHDKYDYHLVGVVEHLGTMRVGHYVAYIRGVAAKGKGKSEKENDGFVWYHASDAYVREASLEEVLRCEAYILFYEKI